MQNNDTYDQTHASTTRLPARLHDLLAHLAIDLQRERGRKVSINELIVEGAYLVARKYSRLVDDRYQDLLEHPED